MNFISLQDFVQQEEISMQHIRTTILEYNKHTNNPVVAAIQNNRYISLHQIENEQDIFLIRASDFPGRRILEKSLSFLLVLASKKAGEK